MRGGGGKVKLGWGVGKVGKAASTGGGGKVNSKKFFLLQKSCCVKKLLLLPGSLLAESGEKREEEMILAGVVAGDATLLLRQRLDPNLGQTRSPTLVEPENRSSAERPRKRPTSRGVRPYTHRPLTSPI